MEVDALKAELRRDEGVRDKPYRDSVGKLTAGVGRNLDAKGFHPAEIDLMLANDISEACTDLDRVLPWWRKLDEVRQRVLANMAFNLGVAGLAKFVNTLALIEAGHFEEAAAAMLQSKWAKQVGERAERLSNMMKTGGV